MRYSRSKVKVTDLNYENSSNMTKLHIIAKLVSRPFQNYLFHCSIIIRTEATAVYVMGVGQILRTFFELRVAITLKILVIKFCNLVFFILLSCVMNPPNFMKIEEGQVGSYVDFKWNDSMVSV